jgi:hypothetical protein
MKAIRSCAIVLVSVIAWSLLAGAEDKPAAIRSAAQPAFERIKALSGEWQIMPAKDEKGNSTDEHEPHSGTVTYKVTAGGSAVLETMFGGTDHEMVTMYYVDGDDLALTHYCMLHNRPKMRAEKRSSLDKIVFKCQEEENAKIESEDHMHAATFTFVNADHLKTEWVLYKEGQPDSTHSFELARKKNKKK